MSFSDVTDRDSAAKLKDYIIYVKEDDRPELEEEEFLISDLVGMKVVYSEVRDTLHSYLGVIVIQ